MNPRIVILLLVLAPLVLAQDAGGKAASGAVARKGTIRKTLSAKGTFAPANPAKLKLDLKAYRGELRLVDVKEHGAPVNAGDIIARIDTKSIDRQIVKDRMGLEQAELGWVQAQEKQRMSNENNKAKLARVERDLNHSQAKLDGFLKHEKEQLKESERQGIMSRKYRLEDQNDELVQLEKMYSEDELVDATEEIVLKRSRRRFAQAKARTELSERRRLYRKEYYEAWREEDLHLDVEGKQRSLAHTKRSQEMAARKAKLDMAAKLHGLKRTRERFADLENDRKQFVIRAPSAGMLLHSGAGMKAGSTLRNRSVFAQIAGKQLKVTTSIQEKDILSVKNGMASEVKPTAQKDAKIMGRLSIKPLPAKGVFGAEVAISGASRELKPGMTCKVVVILEEARDVVLVPKSAVKEVEGKKVVELASGEKRAVVTGIADGKDIEIKEGLQVGEKVKR